jgi:SAM-dependent methyltransferase
MRVGPVVGGSSCCGRVSCASDFCRVRLRWWWTWAAEPGCIVCGWRKGYEAHLLDALPLHVEQAREASARQPEAPLASATIGDARRIERPDESADAALLFGPLYHLTEREDRIAALREARRIVRAGGVVVAVGISRFASLIDGLCQGYLADPAFEEIVRGDLVEGQHRNLTGHPEYFTTAYFQRPEELGEELAAAGLAHEGTLAVEGPAWYAKLVRERWDEAELRERVLEAVRLVEREPALLGASAHLLAVGRKA